VTRVLLTLFACACLGCTHGSDTSDPLPVGAGGTVEYLKRIGDRHGELTLQWTPVRRIEVHLFDDATGQSTATAITSDNGDFSFGDIDLPLAFHLEIEARSKGPRLNVWVHDGSSDKILYWAGSQSPDLNIRIDESFLAGAFNVVDLTQQVADLLEGLVSDDVPASMDVGWGPGNKPYCGSCFFEGQNLLDLDGGADEEDAHDDSVVLHELGHYIEFTWGQYDNPTGPHNLEYVIPTLAWSEGFATWLQGAVRDNPIYIDWRPDDDIYTLDLESPPSSTRGTRDGLMSSDLSEALVYGVLWDLSDMGDGDDDVADYNPHEVLEAALQIKGGADLGSGGADFVDFLNQWRCLHPEADDLDALDSILESVDFPYEQLPAPACEDER
jgi:hypothetical protein